MKCSVLNFIWGVFKSSLSVFSDDILGPLPPPSASPHSWDLSGPNRRQQLGLVPGLARRMFEAGAKVFRIFLSSQPKPCMSAVVTGLLFGCRCPRIWPNLSRSWDHPGSPLSLAGLSPEPQLRVQGLPLHVAAPWSRLTFGGLQVLSRTTQWTCLMPSAVYLDNCHHLTLWIHPQPS